MSEVNEMLTIGLLTPTVHMNGTSREELIQQLCDAHHAINKAQEVLAQAAPNGRDYYPQGADAMWTAQKQHRTRVARLAATAAELMAIAEIIGA